MINIQTSSLVMQTTSHKEGQMMRTAKDFPKISNNPNCHLLQCKTLVYNNEILNTICNALDFTLYIYSL